MAIPEVPSPPVVPLIPAAPLCGAVGVFRAWGCPGGVAGCGGTGTLGVSVIVDRPLSVNFTQVIFTAVNVGANAITLPSFSTRSENAIALSWRMTVAFGGIDAA